MTTLWNFMIISTFYKFYDFYDFMPGRSPAIIYESTNYLKNVAVRFGPITSCKNLEEKTSIFWDIQRLTHPKIRVITMDFVGPKGMKNHGKLNRCRYTWCFYRVCRHDPNKDAHILALPRGSKNKSKNDLNIDNYQLRKMHPANRQIKNQSHKMHPFIESVIKFSKAKCPNKSRHILTNWRMSSFRGTTPSFKSPSLKE